MLASIPFRFKARGDEKMPSAVQHSHRPTAKVSHKSFKSRKATKGQLREEAKGRLPNKGKRKTRKQEVMSKINRRNHSRQQMLKKQRQHAKDISVFSGRDGAPRIVAVIPLCEHGDAFAAVRQLNCSVDIDAEIQDGPNRVLVDRFKQKLQYIPMRRDLSACLDAARVADFILFILSATEEVDEYGELILRSIEGQGLSTMFTAVEKLDTLSNAKEKTGVVGSLKSYMSHFHPEQEKIYSIENRQECSNLMRSLCTTTPKGIRWRDERSWMLVEEVQAPDVDEGLTVLTGVVRGKGLKADRLVQVGDWGTFQIDRIEAAPRVTHGNGTEGTAMDEDIQILDQPTEDQDSLDQLAPPNEDMADIEDADMDVATTASAPTRRGVLLDDYQYFSDEEPEVREMPKKLPKGTSNYQSAWFVGDEEFSDAGSDLDDDVEMEVDDAPAPEDGLEGQAAPAPTDGAGTEYAKSVAFEEMDDDREAKELEQYRSNKKTEAEEDLEFPDEIELHPKVVARERLMKFRGLKSLRESPWDESEDGPHEPEDWKRLLRFQDSHGARVRAAREALAGGVAPGTCVRVYLKGVSPEDAKSYIPAKPLTMVSLLRHEHKNTVLNFLINLPSDYPVSIKAKEEFIVQCGPRQFIAQLVFSQSGSTPNDVHKFCRFLHPGQSAIASFIGPVTWGSVPTLFYKPTGTSAAETEETSLPLHLAATGTALPPSTSRVVAKRIILTGHPYHIHRKVVTIRYMFFNREDVQYFKALPLWTKRGRIGHVKEALGTHGYFKAIFNERINPQDTIGVSLYKRVWPRNAVPWKEPLLNEVAEEEGDQMEE
ncbi:Ribosome biogenesis protein BMS1/TSR1 [Zalerion maritima]|uniref:Ribosome biogenesis protein BMS1/TSR1 n=1 Tax=Zalerion maritima TaxID=339359 RepID=A0AAD5RIX9_9PEZI|nr:Ribosome biogenesis protein BMS1/TSR1 [Zalerion maritima]